MHLLRAVWWWIEVHTGTVNESGPYYGLFSGFGSDIGEVTLLGGVIAIYKHKKCASCPRIAKHPVGHTGLGTCHKHATSDDHEQLTIAHRAKYPHHIAHHSEDHDA